MDKQIDVQNCIIMAPIEIPFNMWSFDRLAIGDGKDRRHKTATSRHKKYGKVGTIFIPMLVVNGDRIRHPDYEFRIVGIQQKFLGTVAINHYYEEGAISAEEFIAVWKGIHNGQFDPKDKVWFHRFVFVPEEP